MATRERGKQNIGRADKDTSGPTIKLNNPPSPINQWNTSSVKYTVDDTIKKIMKEKYDFVEDYQLMDLRLGICTVACLFSGLALVYDYIYPFPASRMVLATCAICYFVMTGVLTLFSYFKEDNIFFVALEKDQAGVGPAVEWTFRSILPRFSNIYKLTVTRKDTAKTEQIEESISNWFDKEGNVVCDKLYENVQNLLLKLDIKKDI